MSEPGSQARDELGRGRLASCRVLLDRVLHDLKQPLSLIAINAQDVRLDVRKGRLDLDSLPETLTQIEAAVRTAVAQLDRLRAFVKSAPLAAGEQTCRVDTVCQAALARIRATGSEVTLEATLPPELPSAGMAAGALEVALLEVLGNALEATSHTTRRQPTIRVSVSGGQTAIAIVIEDSGCGVQEEHRSEIFAPFFSTREGGSGLGLPLAAALVGHVGGHIALARTGEEGSRFEITLPTVSSKRGGA